MKTIKEKLLFMFNQIKQSCMDYRVAMVSVAIATLYAALCCTLGNLVDVESAIWPIIRHEEDVLRFFLLFVLAAVFTESILPYEKKEHRTKIIRILCFVLAAVISAAFIVAQNIVGICRDVLSASNQSEDAAMKWTEGVLIEEWAMRCYIALLLVLMLGILYFIHKKSSVGFIEYMMYVGANFCVVTAIYIVLCIGVLLVLLILDLLLLDDTEALVELSLILLTGFFYVPACIMSLGNMDSNIDDGIGRILVKYVMTGMTICAMLIVYVYLLKILITWEMPSNEIFGIVSGLFCIGMLIWAVDYHYRDDTKYTRFLQMLPYGMIPMIPVQAYAMGVRIYENGMTTARYAGMLLVVFEITVLFIWRFRRDKMELTLIVLCVLVIIAVFLPGINMFSVSNRWQKAFLVSGYNKVASGQEITQREYDRMMGAHKYLRWQPGMEEVTQEYNVNADDFVQMLVVSDLDTTDMTKLESHYIYCSQLVNTIDVAKYSRLDMVDQDERYHDSDYLKENGISAVDFAAFRFGVRNSGEDETIEIDISDFAERCLAYEKEHPDATREEMSNAMRPYQEIIIDDDTVLYLNYFDIKYEDGIKEGEEYFKWIAINISGMLLSR